MKIEIPVLSQQLEAFKQNSNYIYMKANIIYIRDKTARVKSTEFFMYSIYLGTNFIQRNSIA